MPRMTKMEWRVIQDCLIAQECNDRDGRPWGRSNDSMTERQRDKHDRAMESALQKINAALEE